jgi:hypothetical protein
VLLFAWPGKQQHSEIETFSLTFATMLPSLTSYLHSSRSLPEACTPTSFI